MEEEWMLGTGRDKALDYKNVPQAYESEVVWYDT